MRFKFVEKDLKFLHDDNAVVEMVLIEIALYEYNKLIENLS